MSVNVLIKNKTADYIFYLGVVRELEIIPDGEMGIPLANPGDRIYMSFDRCKNPTQVRTFGLGEGVLVYSLDQISEQATFSVLMGPAPAGPQETPAPTFDVSGDITGAGQGNWTKGLELNLYGSDVSQITLSITEYN